MPQATRKAGKKRIMVQVWSKLDAAFRNDLKALHIKRDAYLNDLFAREIQALADEVDFVNPPGFLERLKIRKIPDRVKVTLELDEDLVDRIDHVLSERAIARDSFVNRILFFLVAKEKHLDYLGVQYEKGSQDSAKPLGEALGFLRNPFFNIRQANDGAFYSLPTFSDAPFGSGGPNLFALNTAVSDEAWQMMSFDIDDLFGEGFGRTSKEVAQ